MSVNETLPSIPVETQYFKTLYNMVYLLQKDILDNYKNLPLNAESYSNQLFTSYFKRFFFLINFLDNQMHPFPKYSYALKELATYLGIINENYFEEKDRSHLKVELKNLQLHKSSFLNSIKKSNHRVTHSSYKKGRGKIGFNSQNNSKYSSCSINKIYKLNSNIPNFRPSIPTIVNQETFYNIYNIHNLSQDYINHLETSPLQLQKSNPHHQICHDKRLRNTGKNYSDFPSEMKITNKISQNKSISNDNQNTKKSRSQKENIYKGSLIPYVVKNSKEKIDEISKHYSHCGIRLKRGLSYKENKYY